MYTVIHLYQTDFKIPVTNYAIWTNYEHTQAFLAELIRTWNIVGHNILLFLSTLNGLFQLSFSLQRNRVHFPPGAICMENQWRVQKINFILNFQNISNTLFYYYNCHVGSSEICTTLCYVTKIDHIVRRSLQATYYVTVQCHFTHKV